MKKKLHVKTGDQVIVISGNSKGKIGKVVDVSPKEGKVIVEGANIVKKHVKARPPKEAGGIVEAPAAMYSCKVQLYCDKCGKGVRSAYKFENGEKIRVCAKCGAKI
jgi:large subunit ribosomal protein L24